MCISNRIVSSAFKQTFTTRLREDNNEGHQGKRTHKVSNQSG